MYALRRWTKSCYAAHDCLLTWAWSPLHRQRLGFFCQCHCRGPRTWQADDNAIFWRRLRGLLEDVLQSMRKTWFQRGRASERYRDGQQWFNATYPGKWTGHGGTIRWHPRPTAETPMDYFRVWTPERAGLHSPFQEYLRPLGKNEGSCDVCLMPACKVRRTAICLAVNWSTFEHPL